jgi:hypothetical protein
MLCPRKYVIKNITEEGNKAIIRVSIVNFTGSSLGYRRSRISTENPDNKITPKTIESIIISDNSSFTSNPNNI